MQDLITLDNNNGIEVKISPYGGIITDFIVDGKNIVLGKDSLEDYKEGSAYMGALIGRVANRIKEGKFTLDGKDYSIPINNGPNSNHGGLEGFDSKVWTVKDSGPNFLTLTYHSEDGEEGFPGNVDVTATYTLEDDELILNLEAVSDKATPVSLTNHSYFNLNGSGDIKEHKLKVNSGYITENDENLIPTGNFTPVETTPLDFTEFKTIDEALKNPDKSMDIAGGLDHNFVFTKENDKELREMATLRGDDLVLTIFSDHPGLQIYSGNFLDEKGRNGSYYGQYSGVAMEPQEFPDSINHPDFPNTVIRPGDTYRRTIKYKIKRNGDK